MRVHYRQMNTVKVKQFNCQRAMEFSLLPTFTALGSNFGERAVPVVCVSQSPCSVKFVRFVRDALTILKTGCTLRRPQKHLIGLRALLPERISRPWITSRCSKPVQNKTKNTETSESAFENRSPPLLSRLIQE